MDAADNWACLGWLLDERRMQVRAAGLKLQSSNIIIAV
jgi:hypothetical protein